MTIAELRGSENYSNILNIFSLARTTIEVVGFLKLGGLGACSPMKTLNL